MKNRRQPGGIAEPDRPGVIAIANEPGPDDFWKEPVNRFLVHLAATTAGLTVAYLALVEVTKVLFYRLEAPA